MGFEFNPRAAAALLLRRQGLSLQQIGDELGGVSRQRARQLVQRGLLQEIDEAVGATGPFTEPELWRNRPAPQKNRA